MLTLCVLMCTPLLDEDLRLELVQVMSNGRTQVSCLP